GLPIKAARSGTVINADSAVSTSGNRVVIDHGEVNGSLLATKYHHMTRSVVSPGQSVSQGEVIGYTGTTGNSTGCHLHFETLINGQDQNPLNYLSNIQEHTVRPHPGSLDEGVLLTGPV